MTFENATAMFVTQISTTKLKALYNELIERAVVYARMRVDHLLAAAAKQPSIGHERSIAHNAFITACDTLAEKMEENGEDATWRIVLGQDRKVIGDFACYIHCILGLSAR